MVRLCTYCCRSVTAALRSEIGTQAWRRLTTLKISDHLNRGLRMLQRATFVLAIAAGSLALCACTLAGGMPSRVAVAFYAFALMIGGPIAVLAWFGSLADRDTRGEAQRQRLNSTKSDALLWQDTLLELQGAAWPHDTPFILIEPASARTGLIDKIRAGIVAARDRGISDAKRIKRSILALLIAATSGLGMTGCGVPAEAWAAVQPGMSTAQLVSIVGGPDYVRSNGTGEVWQYCRDFPGRDEGRWARYYTAVFVDKQTVRDVKPYPVLSNAGCEDFYRANF